MLLMDPSYQHREALRGPKASRVTVGSLDMLDLWVQWDLLDKKENMASLVARDDLVCLGGKGTREILLACRDLQVHQVHLDFQEEFLD